MSRGSFQRGQKKGSKFKFLNKLKIVGKEKKSKHYDRLNIEDIIIEEEKNEKPLE